MSTDPLRRIGTRVVPQTERADERQVRNSDVGYVFRTSADQRLRRFLVIGVDGGTFYARSDAAARALALDNAQVVLDASASDHRGLVDTIVEVSEGGLAPRQQPALFALAIACSNGTADERRYAYSVLPRVARIPTHLNTFLNYCDQFRGWGRMHRDGVAAWYLRKPLRELAYQAVKYRNREGWTHRDVLRQAHPTPLPGDVDRDYLFLWMTRGWPDTNHAPTLPEFASSDLKIIEGFARVRRATTSTEVARLVSEYVLPWEAVPDEHINKPDVWDALLTNGVPLTALMRQLPRLTHLGILGASSGYTRRVVAQLTDPNVLRRARVHPLNVLVALRTYARGHGERGSSTWTPSRPIVDALDAAFYLAFDAVEPTGRRMMLALDVSASMTWYNCAGTLITPREASAALALVTARVEKNYLVTAFSHDRGGHNNRVSGIQELTISPRQRMDDIGRTINGLSVGATDCSLPMRYAMNRNLDIDTFVIYTDNETNTSSVHPFYALRQYRERTGIAARLVVCGMTSTGFTIADPTDAGSLDVVGFDTSTPQLISDFARGAV